MSDWLANFVGDPHALLVLVMGVPIAYRLKSIGSFVGAVIGLGFATPYLGSFRGEAGRLGVPVVPVVATQPKTLAPLRAAGRGATRCPP